MVAIAALLLPLSFLRAQAVPANSGPSAAAMPRALQNVGFEPPLNGQMPLDLPFRDETGRSVQLRDYFAQQKPVVLAFVYYGCPMLCDQVEQGVVGALRMLTFNPGRDYDVVFVSFDSRETPEMAAEKKKKALVHFRRPEADSGWHFLTGSKESIEAATQAANFRFSFDARNKTPRPIVSYPQPTALAGQGMRDRILAGVTEHSAPHKFPNREFLKNPKSVSTGARGA